MRRQLDTAIRLSLAAQARNRFAWILLVAFVPVWYLLTGSMIGHAGAVFRLRATGATLVVDGHDLTLITAGLSAITLITGFVVFAAIRRSLPFDRRLVLSGYRPAALMAAKTNAALVQAIAIGIYAAIVILLYWRPPGLWAIALAFILGAATYAAFGLLVGVLVRGDLEGFFLIIMISLLDTFFQNPVDNPLANKPMLEFLPSYAPTQFAAAGAFHHQTLISMAALSLAWTGAFALLGLVVLRLRMPRPAVTGVQLISLSPVLRGPRQAADPAGRSTRSPGHPPTLAADPGTPVPAAPHSSPPGVGAAQRGAGAARSQA
jgi:ABC-2 type transport system permease protein